MENLRRELDKLPPCVLEQIIRNVRDGMYSIHFAGVIGRDLLRRFERTHRDTATWSKTA
jgi:hypothetical protein